jgi:hypothetical protein
MSSRKPLIDHVSTRRSKEILAVLTPATRQPQRRIVLWLLAVAAVAACASVAPVRAQTVAGGPNTRAAQGPNEAQPSAIQRMQEPGSEGQALARLAGVWDVVTTLRLSPTAAATVTSGVVAERKMVGLYLEEEMRPAPGSKTADFRRVSYLTYNKVEGRWQYVSLDTRLPVGIMPAYSFGRGTDRELTLEFEPLGFVGFGAEVEGRVVRSDLVIRRDTDDHDLSQQHWIQADGTGQEWLAVQYEYTRRRGR